MAVNGRGRLVTTLDDCRRTLADEIPDANTILSAFIKQVAARTADEVGFGYVPTPDVPNTYPALVAAFDRSQATGAPLPISSENSDDVIYRDPSTNSRLRFWHDIRQISTREVSRR